jgi:hypothetical protein
MKNFSTKFYVLEVKTQMHILLVVEFFMKIIVKKYGMMEVAIINILLDHSILIIIKYNYIKIIPQSQKSQILLRDV